MSETIKANSTPMNLQPLINDDEDIQVESLPPVPPRPHRRRRWLIALVVIVILALLGGGGMFFYMQKTSTPPVQYTQQAATAGNISLTVSASGPISANAEYDMNFNVTGQVSAINVQVGQQVKAGQTLATLKSTTAHRRLCWILTTIMCSPLRAS
ncbi:MAG: efflux RND transporter periplasmic adaptor subunit [Chloroflexota bacterium]|nr:MAG: efflux RND transporter periplasmic adaptor subunit [Chloroflexota bacterium]